MFFRDQYFFLSNFAFCKIKLNGLLFNSVETAFQAAKTKDLETMKTFCTLTPSQAKQKGRHIKLRSDWEEIKCSVMYSLLKQKFSQQPFKELLIDTGNIHIQEDNYWGDTFWGVCNGQGKNKLGELLMKIREELKEEMKLL